MPERIYPIDQVGVGSLVIAQGVSDPYSEAYLGLVIDEHQWLRCVNNDELAGFDDLRHLPLRVLGIKALRSQSANSYRGWVIKQYAHRQADHSHVVWRPIEGLEALDHSLRVIRMIAGMSGFDQYFNIALEDLRIFRNYFAGTLLDNLEENSHYVEWLLGCFLKEIPLPEQVTAPQAQ